MLTEQNIESELSYAYLHAISTRGGFGCSSAPRHLDYVSVDAQIDEDGRLLTDDSIHASFSLHVQLKATRVPPIEQNSRFSFGLPLHQYNRLREARLATEWLRHSEDALISKRCAYWVSLRGAPESENVGHQTIYIPRTQILDFTLFDDEQGEIHARGLLNADDYAIAGAAHLASEVVAFKGILRRLPRISRVDFITDFERLEFNDDAGSAM